MAVRRARQARAAARSQHFLRDSRLAEELVRLAGVTRGDLALEIGAGYGAVTSVLARRAAYVIAHEIDPALAAHLRERFGPRSAVLVVEGDVLGQPVPRIPFRAVSNVPFHATTQVLHLLLDDPSRPLEGAALIVQWEVARKRAEQATLLGLGWAPWWELRVGRRIPSSAFRPQPAVAAGVLVIERRAEPLLPPGEAKAFRSFLRRDFADGRRRLTLEQWVARYERRSKSCSHRLRSD